MAKYNVPVEGVIFTYSSLTSCDKSSASLLIERLSLNNIPMVCLPRLEGEGDELVTNQDTFDLLPILDPPLHAQKSIFYLLEWMRSAGKWGLSPSSTLIVVHSELNEDMEPVKSNGWKIINMTSDSGNTDITLSKLSASISSLDDLLGLFATTIKEANREGEILVVGYFMKWSREKGLLKRGALPLVPSKSGLLFVPINLNRPLETQMVHVDIVLHKATDELKKKEEDKKNSEKKGVNVTFSEGIQNLFRYCELHTNTCVVDPLPKIMPLLNRSETQKILKKLPGVTSSLAHISRPAKSIEVENLGELVKGKGFLESVSLPSIVKPLIACGVADSHTMAVVFREEGFVGLDVPMPALIQEYVDHGAWQYKCYCIGSSIFSNRKKSTPNANLSFLEKETKQGDSLYQPPSIVFDSLKSLPTSFTQGSSSSSPQTNSPPPPPPLTENIDMETVKATGRYLRETLDLTVFGFDIVVHQKTKDHVVIDVNYFPTFKEIADEISIPAFWDALRKSYSRQTGKI